MAIPTRRFEQYYPNSVPMTNQIHVFETPTGPCTFMRFLKSVLGYVSDGVSVDILVFAPPGYCFGEILSNDPLRFSRSMSVLWFANKKIFTTPEIPRVAGM